MSKGRQLPRVLAERYRLHRQIGGGGMGKVYEAEILKTGLHVAVKMLHPLMAQDHEARVRLARECELVHHVDHEALVPIFDIDEDSDGSQYVVMELLKGLDLRERLDETGCLSIRDALWIGWHVADALLAVHEAKIVHRDLKPENIFLQNQRHVPLRVRILDFGIARARETLADNIRLTREGRALGTPQYMSPEQASGERNVDLRTDVYSLAVVLYESLTGASPYPGGDEASAIYMLQIIRESEPIPIRHFRPDASRSLERLLQHAMVKDREARLASMNEFMAELSRIAAEPLPGAPVTDLEWNDDRRGSKSANIRVPRPLPKRRKTTR